MNVLIPLLTSKRHNLWAIIISLVALLLLSGVALAQFDLPFLDRWIISAGGIQTEAENIYMESSIGQPITGEAIEGVYVLSSGFWSGSESDHSLFLPITMR